MKTIIAIIFSLVSLQALACPNISGTFKDEDDNSLIIVQTKCEQLKWSDSEGSTNLITDNVERVVEKDGDNIAYGQARFTNTDFVLELRVVYSGSVPEDFPTHFLTSYRIDKFNNMVEKIESTQGTSYVTFRRIAP
jgi:hypothetical protein